MLSQQEMKINGANHDYFTVEMLKIIQVALSATGMWRAKNVTGFGLQYYEEESVRRGKRPLSVREIKVKPPWNWESLRGSEFIRTHGRCESRVP